MPRKKVDRNHLVKAAQNVSAVSGSGSDTHKEESHGVSYDSTYHRLHVKFSIIGSPERAQVFDLTHWLVFPQIGIAFAEVFYRQSTRLTPLGRINKFRCLTIFFRFLREHSETASVATLDTLNSGDFKVYKGWLDRQSSSEGELWSHGYKQGIMSHLRNTVKGLHKLPRYKNLIDPRLEVQRSLYPMSLLRHKPTEVLSQDEVRVILQACKSEMQMVMARFDTAAELLSNSSPVTEARGRAEYKDLGVCLATLNCLYPELIPTQRSMRAQNKYLEHAVHHYHGGLTEVKRHLYALSETLVPFVVTLAFHTAFNADTLLALQLDQLSDDWFFGSDRLTFNGHSSVDGRLRINGKKGRSVRDQSRSFAARSTHIMHPVVIVRNVLRITERLRPLAGKWRNRLFLYAPENLQLQKGNNVRSFGDEIESPSAGSWKDYILRHFIERNDLPKFNLSNIRATVSDIVFELADGDIKAQQTILNHASPRTTEDHYTSDGARRRMNEEIAKVQNERERWAATGGKCDARGVQQRSSRRAVTPGFECFDPYDSPVEGQQFGRLCTAYLSCPTCQLATVNVQDPAALGLLVKLEHQIKSVKPDINVERYQETYEPIRKTLAEKWLPLYEDPRIWDRAKDLRLPPFVLE